MKELSKKYLVFVIGLYFLAAGVVLIVRSALGTTPISSVNYVLSLNSSLSLGTCTFIINTLLIIGQFWLIRNNKSKRDIIEILLQFPFSFIFSVFIDLNMLLTHDLHPSNYGMSIACLLYTSSNYCGSYAIPKQNPSLASDSDHTPVPKRKATPPFHPYTSCSRACTSLTSPPSPKNKERDKPP